VKGILLAIVILCPAATWAQDIKPVDVKPGLWENTTTTEMSGMAMPQMPQLTPEQLAQLPPEARARLQAMKGGMGTPRVSTSKACITKEQLSKPLSNIDQSCTAKLVSSTSSSQQIHFDCSRGNTKTVGDLTLNRVDSEHMKGDMAMKATGDGSTPGAPASVTIKVTFNNKWLSADCGDVKPSGSDK